MMTLANRAAVVAGRGGGVRRSLVRAAAEGVSARTAEAFSSDSNSAAAAPGTAYRVHDPMIPTCDETRAGALYRHTRDPKTVSVIGAPMTFGQPFVGTDHGPRLLRDAGLLSSLPALGWRVNDCADLDFDLLSSGIPGEMGDATNARHSRIVGKGCEVLADVVEAELSAGRFPLILGGDHSVGLGSLAGILRARPNTGVIWVDAHADLNTPAMSESGNMHGMPVGLLMKGLDEDGSVDFNAMPGLEWLAADEDGGGGAPPPRLSPDSIVYVGLRDVDRAERAALRRLNIKAFTMHDIDRHGIGSVMDMALDHLLRADPDRPLHLSYDIDAIDPIHAPATGTAVRGGLTYREAHYIAESAARSGSLASAEMVELNPTLSDGEGSRETVELGLGVLTSLLGKSII